jgi:ferredoxin
MGSRAYLLPPGLLRVDRLVNLAGAYRHREMVLAGSMFGLLNGLPGFKQTILNRLIDSGATLNDVVVDLLARLSPEIHWLLMEPDYQTASGVREAGFLLVSSDPVALDSAAAQLAGLSPDSLASIRLAAEAGQGIVDYSLTGVNPQTAPDWKRLPEFDRDRLTSLPARVESFFSAYTQITVSVNRGRCTNCDACRDRCPTGALTIDETGRYSKLRGAICVRCFSCLQACDEGAIEARHGILADWLPRSRTQILR